MGVVVLRLYLEGNDERLLVQVGTWSAMNQDKEAKPLFALPSTKVKGGESPHSALQRLLATDCESLAAHIQTDSVEVVSDRRPSDKYGVETSNLRFIFHARLNVDFKALVVLLSDAPESKHVMPAPSCSRPQPHLEVDVAEDLKDCIVFTCVREAQLEDAIAERSVNLQLLSW